MASLPWPPKTVVVDVVWPSGVVITTVLTFEVVARSRGRPPRLRGRGCRCCSAAPSGIVESCAERRLSLKRHWDFAPESDCDVPPPRRAREAPALCAFHARRSAGRQAAALPAAVAAAPQPLAGRAASPTQQRSV